MLQQGALRPLLALLSENHKLSMLRNATWTLSNFCRGKSPQPDWDLVRLRYSLLRNVHITHPFRLDLSRTYCSDEAHLLAR